MAEAMAMINSWMRRMLTLQFAVVKLSKSGSEGGEVQMLDRETPRLRLCSADGVFL